MISIQLGMRAGVFKLTTSGICLQQMRRKDEFAYNVYKLNRYVVEIMDAKARPSS